MGVATFTLSAHVTDTWGTSTNTNIFVQSSSNGRSWKSIASLYTNPGGNVSKKLTAKKKSTTYYRWVIKNSPLYYGTSTAKQRVTVK